MVSGQWLVIRGHRPPLTLHFFSISLIHCKPFGLLWWASCSSHSLPNGLCASRISLRAAFAALVSCSNHALPDGLCVSRISPQTFRFALVGSSGLEPPTSRLSGVRSNHLSYEPISRSEHAGCGWFFAASTLPPACAVGGDERDRTDDPLLAKQVLSQLSYTPIWMHRAACAYPKN